jgi:hypothetical protein
MMPGPYLTPLSSSLCAVVADSLRRDHDMSPSRRRMARSSQTNPDESRPGHADESMQNDLNTVVAGSDGSASPKIHDGRV